MYTLCIHNTTQHKDFQTVAYHPRGCPGYRMISLKYLLLHKYIFYFHITSWYDMFPISHLQVHGECANMLQWKCKSPYNIMFNNVDCFREGQDIWLFDEGSQWTCMEHNWIKSTHCCYINLHKSHTPNICLKQNYLILHLNKT